VKFKFKFKFNLKTKWDYSRVQASHALNTHTSPSSYVSGSLDLAITLSAY